MGDTVAGDIGTRAGYSAPALEKGLDILELLAESSEPMTARQIGERLGRSKNEIFRMVYVLVDRGYLTRDPNSDQLSLTNRLFHLGMRTPQSRSLVELALPAMERLSETVSFASHLVVLNQGQTVVIANAAARSEFSFSLQLGYSRPALNAVSGLVILAFQSAERRHAMIAQGPVRPADIEALEAQMKAIVDHGYLQSDSHHILGVTDICAPILDQVGRGIASVVIPCLRRIGDEIQFDQVREALVSTCSEISHKLL